MELSFFEFSTIPGLGTYLRASANPLLQEKIVDLDGLTAYVAELDPSTGTAMAYYPDDGVGQFGLVDLKTPGIVHDHEFKATNLWQLFPRVAGLLQRVKSDRDIQDEARRGGI